MAPRQNRAPVDAYDRVLRSSRDNHYTQNVRACGGTAAGGGWLVPLPSRLLRGCDGDSRADTQV
jgi:hypothetical protein